MSHVAGSLFVNYEDLIECEVLATDTACLNIGGISVICDPMLPEEKKADIALRIKYAAIEFCERMTGSHIEEGEPG